MSSKRSRVHPPYKTKYRVINWATYNKALVDRGNLRLWISPDAIANRNAKPRERRRGPALDPSPVIPSDLSFGYLSAELKSPVKIPILR